jgi:hypothetical protein
VIVEVVQSLARYGPKRFYVLNTGGAAVRPLADAAKALEDSGILLGWTDMRYQLANARITPQQHPVEGAPHADEIETSMMLAVDPTMVDMKKAVAEYGRGTGVFTRKDEGSGIVSKSGVLGDPTVATAEKGRVLIDTLVSGILADIESLRTATLPTAKSSAPAPPPRPTPPPLTRDRRQPNGCTPSDERAIRQIGPKFGVLWRQMDAVEIGKLFTLEADIRHPDGTIERTRDVIRQNREQLFQRREYRGSVHAVDIAEVRCLGGNYAIADGKWELRFADIPGSTAQGTAPASPNPPSYHGLFTLVVGNNSSEWSIEAWRYTVTPDQGPPPPTVLKQPGFIGRGF